MEPTFSERDAAVVSRALDGHLTSAYQPIVDLMRGVVMGYEALLRYRGDATTVPGLFSPRELLATAARVGRAAEMEAAALEAALQARVDLPPQCMLFLNVGVDALSDERVDRVLRRPGGLEGVVLELKRPGEASLLAAKDTIDLCRDRGALIAIDDTFGQSGWMSSMLSLEPGFLKLDRELVRGVSESNTKLAIVDSVRHLADRLGVGVIAQGIEDLADLRSLERIGVGLGQGYLMARPSTDRRFVTAFPTFATDADRSATGRELHRYIEAVCELTDSEMETPLPGATNGIEFEVLVSDLREPLALLRRVGRRIVNVSLTLIDESVSVQAAVKIALRRPQSIRFDPMVCVDEFGACAGVIRIERLVDALAGDVRPTPASAAASAVPTHRSRHTFDFSCRPAHRSRER